jgi:hypothetical protein
VPSCESTIDSAFSSNALAFLSRDCRYVQINRHLTEICGISVDEHIGRSVRETVPCVADQVEKIVELILSKGEPITGIASCREARPPLQPAARARTIRIAGPWFRPLQFRSVGSRDNLGGAAAGGQIDARQVWLAPLPRLPVRCSAVISPARQSAVGAACSRRRRLQCSGTRGRAAALILPSRQPSGRLWTGDQRGFLTRASGPGLPLGEPCPLGGPRAQPVVILLTSAYALISSCVDHRRNRIVDRGVQFGRSPFAGNTGI